MAAVVGLAIGAQSPVAADETWNPFADKDERARKRARSNPAVQSRQDPRPPLAPMSGGDWPRNDVGRRNGAPTAPQPYPATPPGYATGNYQPPGTAAPNTTAPVGGAGAYPGVPYGAPGTYLPPSSSGGESAGLAAPSIERGELTPVISSGAGLSEGAWKGLDYAAVEQLLGPVQLPPASPALNRLFERIVAKRANERRLNAVLISALLKAGRFAAADRLRDPNAAGSRKAGSGDSGAVSPVEEVLHARLELALGKNEAGCNRIKRTVAKPKGLPRGVRGEAIVMAGYCAIVSGNKEAGGLAAELARDAGYNRPFTIGLLEAIASGARAGAPVPRSVTTLDGLLALQLKQPNAQLMTAMLARADAGFLQLIARSQSISPGLRLRAAERAAASNVVSSEILADAYRAAVQEGAAASTGPALERARHFVAAEQNQAQFARTRELRALLDSARRAGLYHAVAVAAAPIVRGMRPAQEISWFTETAVEILAAGGDYQAAGNWVRAAPAGARGGALQHWLMLLDVADVKLQPSERGQHFQVVENLAAQGRFSQPALHRLATVLDALDYNVPIPLWNLASRSEAPQTGHLPETGYLSAMKQASQSGQVAATLLYALRTISPKGTGATHLLGLGDTIRALKRAGLQEEARQLGFEALFADWPRSG